jgi:hypothetical protein
MDVAHFYALSVAKAGAANCQCQALFTMMLAPCAASPEYDTRPPRLGIWPRPACGRGEPSIPGPGAPIIAI